MALDEQEIKLTAQERREHSDRILDEVYGKLMAMQRLKKVNGKAIAIMDQKSSA